MVNRFDVYLINLDPHLTKDAKNTRPAVVISPDEVNRHLSSVIIAPISSAKMKYPTRVSLNFLNNERSVVLDQIRAVDKERLVKKIGEIDSDTRSRLLDRLQELFAE
jgi:mRNA interferase MazF